MDKNVSSKRKSNILLIMAIIAFSLVVIWLITIFDRIDDSAAKKENENNLIKQTFSDNLYHNFFDLLTLEKNYT